MKQIRPATLQDIPALLLLAERFINTESNIDMQFDAEVSRSYLEQYINHHETVIFVPDDVTALIMASVCRDWSVKPVCYIENLYVSPCSRGNGLSRVLIQTVQNYAKLNNCSHVFASNHSTLGERVAKMFDNMLAKSGFNNCGSNFVKAI